MSVRHPYLFNFSASPVGGGLKRLYEYARWFDAHGGARFAVHARNRGLADECPRNEYVFVEQSAARRMVGTQREIRGFVARTGPPRCYYAYGIPMHERLGALNWFHLSNVLPLAWRHVPMPVGDRLKFALLGCRITGRLKNAEVISAESAASLALLDPAYRDRLFLSVNGSDDELAYLARGEVAAKEPVATVVGTYRHKALEDSCLVFEMLRRREPGLTLQIFGDPACIPSSVTARAGVVAKGNRPRAEVVAALRVSKVYISTTRIENSYNAASEGIFFADESYVSDIGPHRELLDGMPYDHVAVPGVSHPLIHVTGRRLSGANLRSWDQVVTAMIARIEAPPDAGDEPG